MDPTPVQPATPAGPFNPALVSGWIDRGLDACRRLATPRAVEASLRFFVFVGHAAILAGAAVGLLLTIALAAKENSFTTFLAGMGWLVALFVLQFTAVKMLGEGDALIRSTASQMCSRRCVDCLALVALLLGWLLLIASLVMAVRMESLTPLWSGLALFVFVEAIAAFALNPESLNMAFVPDSTAGQEAIGITALLLKALLRLVPVVFGTGAAIGVLRMIVEGIVLLKGDYVQTVYGLPGAASGILLAVAAPLIGYLLFLLSYLSIDLARSLLVLPGKVDALRKT